MPRLDPELVRAVDMLRAAPGVWAHVATVSPDGSPHVTPMMLGRDDDHLLLSLTGRVKRANLARDPRVAISLAHPGDMAHVVVWGRVELRSDAWAQQRWERLLAEEGGPDLLAQERPRLSRDTTMLGVVHPTRHRIYGIAEVPTDPSSTPT